MRFVLIVIKASGCHACQNFKNSGKLDKVIKYCKTKENISRIIEIDINQMNKWRKEYKQYLSTRFEKYLGYFPSIMLVEEESFNDETSKLNILIYGKGNIGDTLVSMSGYPLHDKHINTWIDTKLSRYN